MKKQKSGKLTLKAFLFVPMFALSLLLIGAMLPNPIITQETQAQMEEAPLTEITKPVVSTKIAIETSDEEVTQPTFPGGMQAMRTFLSKNLQYPPAARDKGIAGTVYVKFTVKKSGEVAKVSLARGISSQDAAARALEKEAIRVCEMMPKWNPGTKNGKAVAVEMSLPIKFQLD